MVDSLTVNEEDQNSDELNFVEPSDSQFDEGDEMDYKDKMTDSEADGEEVMYCDVDDMGPIDDMGPVELSDRQSDEMQSPYIIFLKPEDNDPDNYTTEDIKSSDFEFSESFPMEAEKSDSEIEKNDLEVEKNDSEVEKNDLNVENEEENQSSDKKPVGNCGTLLNNNMVDPRQEKILPATDTVSISYDKFSVLINEADEEKIDPYERTYSKKCLVGNDKSSHLKSISCDGKLFLCSICNRVFPHRYHLIVHVQVHNSPKPSSCRICSRSFCTESAFKVHMGIHAKCSCEKAFIHKPNSTMQIHVNEKPFSCSVGRKSRTCKRNLTNHVVIHNEESFQNSKPLFIKKHRTMIRSVERLFLCSISYRTGLSRHVHLVHNSEPITCLLCSHTFINKYCIERHIMRIHTGDGKEPFTCSRCRKSFPKKVNFLTHVMLYIDEKLNS